MADAEYEIARDDDDAATADFEPVAPRGALHDGGSKWRGRDAKRDVGALVLVTALLWISAMPMRRSQERALRGLTCLALVVFAALLIGWAVRRAMQSEAVERRSRAAAESDDAL
jgi:hypothetical protein|eukprot:Tamp_16265.p3 GENE.Tamp_16265~~Tamp_16265.p3  ORF type:complete len:114 (+),score=26.45 Tamp_16265:235-576(+)